MTITKKNIKKSFYNTINNKWLSKTKRPKIYSKWDNFTILQENIDSIILMIVKNKNNQKLFQLYNSAFIKKSNFKFLSNEILEISNIDSYSNLIESINQLLYQGINSLFDFYVDGDQKNNNINSIYISQLQLGLPDISFYLKPTNILGEYKKYISKLFLNLGGISKENSLKFSQTIIDIETDLAKASYSREILRDVDKTYNKYTYQTFVKKFPNIPIDRLIKEKKNTLIVNNPKFFVKINSLLKKMPLIKWKIYLLYIYFNNIIDYFDDNLYSIKFNFFGRYINGQSQMKSYTKRIINIVNYYLGELIGDIYIKKYFSDTIKNDVTKISKNILLSMKNTIKNCIWMSSATKQKALSKLSNISIDIGYPRKTKNYSNIHLTDCFFENIKILNIFHTEYEISKIGKLIDKDYWDINPHTINAYFHPVQNKIVIPAGILQSPFYSLKQTDAQNYGGIGCIIGHELTHAFDDQGRKYDANGNLNEWWSKTDTNNYTKLSESVINQYNNTKFLSKNVNGLLTLGENISDIGGVKLALSAYKNICSQNNINPDIHKFFSSWAKNWRCLITNKHAKNLLLIDPHSPNQFRVDLVLAHVDDYYQLYNIDKKYKYYLEKSKRQKIW